MSDLTVAKIARRKRWFEGPSGEAEWNRHMYIRERLEHIEKTSVATLHLLSRMLDLLEPLLDGTRERRLLDLERRLSTVLRRLGLQHLYVVPEE
jgi:hypothetical protein